MTPTGPRQPVYQNLRAVGRWFVYASIVGCVAGLGAIVFNLLCQVGLHYFLDVLAGFRPPQPGGEGGFLQATDTPFRPWMLLLVPALGGLLAGIIIYRWAPEAEGHGTDAAIDAFHRHHGLIRARVPFIKTIASALSIGSGGSGGREGPIAQIGAGFGSFLALRLGLAERDRRILLAAGVGAGVGSIFRAPLAGALFAAEILYSDPDFEPDVIIPAGIATIVAYCVFSFYAGFGSLFHTPLVDFHSPLELIPYSVLALVVALGAGLFVTLFYRTHDVFSKLPIRRELRPMIGGFLAGAVGLGLHAALKDKAVLDVLAFGYGSLQSALDGKLAILTLAALAIGKMLTTSLTISSGGSGGVFGPSMVIGGALGGVVGMIAHDLAPTVVTHPASYVVVGMAGFFAAAANTPISTLVMVSEMTGNYRLLVPSLWVCTFAYMIGRHWKLYKNQVPTRFDSPAHRGDFYIDVLENLRVRDVLGSRVPRTIPESATLDQIVETLTNSAQQRFPVVDGGGRITGMISVTDVQQLLDEREAGPLLIARDIAGAPEEPLRPDDNLNTALERFVAMDVAELPVAGAPDDPEKVTGMLSRRDLIAAYNQRRLEHASESRRAAEGGPGV
ncbi:MAG: chloride channel protein [Hyphomicrobiales bacterium]